MIAFVEGILEESHPLRLVVNVAGVGYELNAPLSTSTQVGKLGEKVRLHTQLVVREDSHQLYGFSTLSEKNAFLALTEKVSGIGPKTALNILSRLSVQALHQAVTSGNVTLLTQCPGIGKKTAERLILELKDVFAKQPVFEPGTGTGVAMIEAEPMGQTLIDDAVAALVTLGFKAADAQRRVEQVIASASEPPNVAKLIKLALNA